MTSPFVISKLRFLFSQRIFARLTFAFAKNFQLAMCFAE